MNKRDVALRIAHDSETLDKLNWVARWRALMENRTSGVPMFEDRVALYAHVNSPIGDRADSYMPAGTIVMFDQSFIHEFRPWADYLAAYRRDFNVVGLATRGIRAAVVMQ